ncbi:MAG: HlyD family efflux transporter periplasmic adaptor subunit [Oscillospiraceae bacterium]|jgi:multidrug efflux pump subunit AcrA (membrane-fusion protein)|nr:HlyD family efflux transporter periplasmic adaptor subunit [Oscillospiraceae bacterium]
MEQTMEPVAQTTPAQSAVETPTPAGAPGSAPTPPKSRKKRKKTTRRIIALVLVIALGFGLYRHFGKKEGAGEQQVVKDTVMYGSITSTVEGSGMVKAKNSETITLATAGTVGDVFVTEGQKVAAGDPLFTYDSPEAEKRVRDAKSNIEGYQKQLNAAYKDVAALTLTAPYAGKLMNTTKLTVGEETGTGGTVATLVDDTRMRLTQYFSYAYEGELYAGQTVQVSIPALMATVEGTVEKVHMVKRVTSEGSELFSAEIVVPNAGVLAKDMEASATAVVNGETVYPYETGKLDYYRTSDLTVPTGTVVSTNLLDYLSVSAGQLLVQVNGENTENKIFDLEQSLQKAQKELEEAEKNAAYANAVAPIDGTVIGLSIYAGQEVTGSTAALTISDTSTVTVSATVDERNVSYLKVGMSVNLSQWNGQSFGTISSVSLSSSANNGVVTYPFTIEADNTDGTLQVNSYVDYNLTASQSDNCLVLPIQAVRTVGLEDGTSATVVYVQADSEPDNMVQIPYMDEEIPAGFYPVQVEIGIQDNYNVEIKSGVEEGTVVFTQIMSDNVWG